MSVTYYYRRVPYSEFEELQNRLRENPHALEAEDDYRRDPPIGEYYDYLDPQEVKELKEALDELTLEQLKSYCRLIPARVKRHPEDFDPAFLWSAVEKLRTFLKETLFFSEIVTCYPD